jgi:3-oxoacyl-[acyl-carrier-protein] synthase III
VVGSEVLSRIVDQGDRSTAILFGDGAGAVVLAPSEQPGIISTHLHADGSYKHLMYCTGGPSRGAAPGAMLPGDFVRMAGSEVFKLAVTLLGRVVDETLAANNLERSAIDWLVPHQANIRIIQAVAKKLNLPMGRRHRDGAGARQHFDRFSAAGAGCRGARRTYQTRRYAAARGVGRWRDLGFGAGALLMR